MSTNVTAEHVGRSGSRSRPVVLPEKMGADPAIATLTELLSQRSQDAGIRNSCGSANGPSASARSIPGHRGWLTG
ncbi:hypothetical protein [Skermania sp. ID1734]|uniref:hypothetical protein n=1 Tax=Skermania sp. ID1734 TaxID=2597516 RepID=UPI0021023F10|nr:hypothetical protein [Skermania sp. ID1734]